MEREKTPIGRQQSRAQRHFWAQLVACACGSFALSGCESEDGTVRDASGGAGGTGGVANAGAPSSGGSIACPDAGEGIDPTALIDDMEDRDDALARIADRNGAWWTGHDDTSGATIQPSAPVLPELIPGERCGSRYAMHVTGQGFNDWGASLGLGFRYAMRADGEWEAAPVDAHIRTGITFWARIGDTSTNRIRVNIGDVHSAPVAGLCQLDGPPDQGCYSTFGVYLTELDSHWKRYQIPFAGLTQPPFGLQADALDTERLYDIAFAFDSGAIFDLWVDDLKFY
jgi:hypothetical protein